MHEPDFILISYSFAYAFFAGYGLKCYECGSTKSWDDCTSVRKEVTCDSSSDRCVKAVREGTQDDVSVALYAKSCAESSACDPDTSKFCKSDDLGKVRDRLLQWRFVQWRQSTNGQRHHVLGMRPCSFSSLILRSYKTFSSAMK